MEGVIEGVIEGDMKVVMEGVHFDCLTLRDTLGFYVNHVLPFRPSKGCSEGGVGGLSISTLILGFIILGFIISTKDDENCQAA